MRAAAAKRAHSDPPRTTCLPLLIPHACSGPNCLLFSPAHVYLIPSFCRCCPLPAARNRAAALKKKRMLRRKPTRIELKPDDRDEYFAHKATKPDSEQNKEKQQSEKDVRIGVAKPR